MVIVCREKGWFDERTDFRLWDHLCRGFKEELQLVDDFSDAEIPDGRPIVILDESAEDSLLDFEHPEDAVYLFGRAGLNRMQEQYYSDYAVSIPTEVCQFGVVAAGMVMYDRMIKNGNTNT